MKRLFVALALMLVLSTPVAFSDYFEDLSMYSMEKSLDNSDIVAVGTVSLLEGVFRRHLLGPNKNAICTDVLVRVETMIKGEPNFGDNYIKFMVRGGRAYVPHRNSVMINEVSTQAKFKVGEKVLIMLSSDQNTTFYANYPYGKARLIYDDYGKRLIKDDKAMFLYEKEGKPKGMPLSVDLVKDLGKAFVRNKAEAIKLEKLIKAQAAGENNALTSELEASLLEKSKKIKAKGAKQ